MEAAGDILDNLSMSVVSTAHRLYAMSSPSVVPRDSIADASEIEEGDPDKTVMDPEVEGKVRKFIQSCETVLDEERDESVSRPVGPKQKIVYHLMPFSDLFHEMLTAWSGNCAVVQGANYYVERMPDVDKAECSPEVDELLVKFVDFNLCRPTERSDWCVIEAPLNSRGCFEHLLEFAFFKTTLTPAEVESRIPANGRRQTRFVLKDTKAVLSLHDSYEILHGICDEMRLCIIDQPVMMTRTVGSRAERHKYSMKQFVRGDIERHCWVECSDYIATFRIHLPADKTVNTVNIYYYLEHIEDATPEFTIIFEHMLHFPVVSFGLERNVEHEFVPRSSRK
ncbi:hypothetical protein L596_009068 [Steinernema carpocapsae]|uniref:Uncharacterized protein n=1 Tax=Steinernema carpocapsae TaxID=34508 RepID=A0A4U5PEU6_STECR|nr:hypothetical protein L596_009068 [Steinernema carpocapsae]